MRGYAVFVALGFVAALLVRRAEKRRLGFASGAYYMGVPVGIGVSLLIAGYLGPAIGWRNCFYLLGAIGGAIFMGVVLLVVLIGETGPTARSGTPRGRAGLEQT